MSFVGGWGMKFRGVVYWWVEHGGWRCGLFGRGAWKLEVWFVGGWSMEVGGVVCR